MSGPELPNPGIGIEDVIITPPAVPPTDTPRDTETDFTDITTREDDDGNILDLPAISPFYYVRVSDNYANSYFMIKQAMHNLRSALITIVSLDPEIERDLIGTAIIMDENTTLQNYARNLSPAIRALHSHIARRGRYGNINEYLLEQEIAVSPYWAELCEVAGTPIEEQFIY